MHDACSLKSKLSCNHSWFIFFLSAEIRPKNGNKNTTIHLSTRILGFKSKRWSLGFLKIVQPKIQKIHLFKQNLWIQVKKMDFWISQGFFWDFFLDSSKGCLDFWVSKSKIQKNSRKKMDFSKKSKKPQGKRWIFARIQKNLGKRWIFPILISKIQKKPREKMDFLQKSKKKNLGKKIDFSNPDIKNPKKTQGKRWIFSKKSKKNAGKSWIFAKINLFSLSFFGFLIWKPKNPNTLSKNPKKIKKKPWEIQKSIFLTWIQRFCLKRWIFGFLDFWAGRLDHASLQHSDIRCIFAWNTLLKCSHIVASPGTIFNY